MIMRFLRWLIKSRPAPVITSLYGADLTHGGRGEAGPDKLGHQVDM